MQLGSNVAGVVALLVFQSFLSAQERVADEKRAFQTSVARLRDGKSAYDEGQRLWTPYRRALHIADIAFDRAEKDQDRLSPGLIETARMLRAVDCSRYLAEHVDQMSPGAFDAGPLAAYPAAQTLVEFGSASFPSIFSTLRDEASEKQLRLFAVVFLKIDGKRLAAVRLEEALEEHVNGRSYLGPEDPFVKNVRRIRDLIQTVDFSKPANWPR